MLHLYKGDFMETYKPYNKEGKVRLECLNQASNWAPPTGDEIRMVLSMAGWSGVEFAKKVNTNDRTVRRWIGNELPIPYAAWCILCVEANLGEIWK